MRKLVTVGDDFGFCSGINKGFMEAYDNGFLKEMSLMLNCPGTQEAVDLVKQKEIRGIGIHITFMNLNEDGVYLKTKDYEKMLEELSKDEIVERVKREVDQFESLFGKLPTHINSHQYTDRHKKIFEFLVPFAEENNIAIRSPKIETKGGGMQIFDINYDLEILSAHKAKTTDYSIAEVYGNIEEVKKSIIDQLSAVPDNSTVEFSFHPAFIDETLRKYTSLLDERERDVKLLTDKSLEQEIINMGYEIVDYSNL